MNLRSLLKSTLISGLILGNSVLPSFANEPGTVAVAKNVVPMAVMKSLSNNCYSLTKKSGVINFTKISDHFGSAAKAAAYIGAAYTLVDIWGICGPSKIHFDLNALKANIVKCLPDSQDICNVYYGEDPENYLNRVKGQTIEATVHYLADKKVYFVDITKYTNNMTINDAMKMTLKEAAVDPARNLFGHPFDGFKHFVYKF